MRTINTKGFTLIELMIVIAIVAILAAIVVPLIFGGKDAFSNSNINVGYNGVTETRCIEGFKFVVGDDGGARQIMDETGHGVRCN